MVVALIVLWFAALGASALCAFSSDKRYALLSSAALAGMMFVGLLIFIEGLL